MKSLYYYFRSKFDSHYNKVDGVWVFDEFDTTSMKPVFTVLTGKHSGIKIILLHVSLHMKNVPDFHVMFEKDGSVLPSSYDPGFDTFVKKMMYRVFDLKETNED